MSDCDGDAIGMGRVGELDARAFARGAGVHERVEAALSDGGECGRSKRGGVAGGRLAARLRRMARCAGLRTGEWGQRLRERGCRGERGQQCEGEHLIYNDIVLWLFLLAAADW